MSRFPALSDLPSRTLPQRTYLCPTEVIEAIRSRLDIDVDVVWGIDRQVITHVRGNTKLLTVSCWTVLERCEDQDRWAQINGERVTGYREAYHHCDRDTGEAWPLGTLPAAIAERDVGAHMDDDLDTYVDNVRGALEEPALAAKDAFADAVVHRAEERAADRWKTLLRTPGLIEKEARRIERDARRRFDMAIGT